MRYLPLLHFIQKQDKTRLRIHVDMNIREVFLPAERISKPNLVEK